MQRGVSLIEILIASLVLSLALLSLFVVNSSSSQMTLDSYYEFQAVQIAQEPIEVFRAVGYPACTKLPSYPIGKSEPLSGNNGCYPVEASMFDRTIALDTSGPPPYVVTVSVAPRANTLARNWMRKKRGSIVMKGVIPVVR